MYPVIACPSCAEPNVEGSRFCNSCGASLRTSEGIQERRVVTALFADLARSTSLGEQLDPEIVRGIVGRFFELARREIERRGGTIEKFSGDAVMAVFGLPAAHEDDPERAVRAAVAILDGLREVSDETKARHGVRVQARIGIEGGEVVVGDPFGGATMATGDALNVAARLEQLAQPGEIVVGPQTWEHVRDLVDGEPLGELAIHGREAAAAAWRIHSISAHVGRPRGVPGLEAPLTGRDEELTLLVDAARRARRERKAVLFTILGVPGVGKSRLVREAIARLTSDGWSVVRGRCLPYGEGITYWPLAEMLRELAGIDAETSAAQARDRLAELARDEEVAGRLALVLGSGGAGQASQGDAEREIAWAFRRLIEQRTADSGPHVLVFEDIHWAEPALLDLIEYLVTWTRDAPLLVITPSRPELLDRRPGWGSGRMEASRIQLEPLSEAESRKLLAALLTVEDLPASLRQRVLDRAEGNPLFVEEVVRMLIEEGVVEQRDGRWYARGEAAEVRVPDTVEALIRARLDTLPAPERAVLQAAAVVGRVFQHSAVAALASEAGGDSADEPATRVEAHLEDAVLRDLITEERSPDERTFRFRHVIIRDVAYATLPKTKRAQLHGQAAVWLREWARSRIDEFIEIEAYHLEQAVLLRRELEGRAEPGDSARAAEALRASALKALARDDAPGTLVFSERALALDPPAGETSLELAWLRVEALRRLGEWRRSGELAEEVESEAERLGRTDIQGRAMLARAGDIWISLNTADAPGAIRQLEECRQLLAQAGDTYYLSAALELLGYGGWWFGDLSRAETIWWDMARVARDGGDLAREAEAHVLLAGVVGQRGEVERRRELLEEARRLAEQSGSRLTRARVERAFAYFLAMSVSGDEAEAHFTSVIPIFEEFSDRYQLHTALTQRADIQRRRGRLEDALDGYQAALAPVLAHVGYRPEVERRIAETMLQLGRLTEAAEWAARAAEHAGRDDIATVASTGMVVGAVRDQEGRTQEAEAALRDAAELIHGTDYSAWEQDIQLAEFLLRHGRADEAAEWIQRARTSAAVFGANSPISRYVEGRLRAVGGGSA